MNKCLKTFFVAGLATVILAGWAMADERDKPPAAQTSAAAERGEQTRHVTYLGVAVEPLHPAFWAHLRDVLEHKQGLLVSRVAKDSPADKAGLKEHDILMTYGDQKLFSPEQLVGLIQADKAGQQVAIGIAREGKTQQITVTLGEHPFQTARAARRIWGVPGRLSRRTPSGPDQSTKSIQEGEDMWTSFDSLSIRSLGNDRYMAEVSFETEKGKIERRKFEGTRTEIQRDIRAQKDLPANEREHLLRALDLPNDELEFDFPAVYFTPDGRVVPDFGLHDAY